MPHGMNLTKLSRRVALSALTLAVAGSLTVSAFGQTNQDTKTAEEASRPAAGNGLALATFAEPSAAATTATNNMPAPPPSGGYSWTGVYVGANLGHGSGSAADTFVNPLPSAAVFINLLPQTLPYSPSGVIGGGQLGYNWQRGHLVFGAEVDISGASIQQTRVVSPIIQNNGTPFPPVPPPVVGNSITAHEKTDALATFRPRVGVTLGSRFLVYGTGGLAIGHVGYTANTDFQPVGTENYPVNFSKTRIGWTGGGGAEVAVGKGWSLRGEYLHYALGGAQTVTANPSPALPPFQIAYSWPSVSGNIARFGMNYKF